MNIKQLGNMTVKLARNPLGLIVLSLGFVYAIVGYIVFHKERMILVWFLAIFPFFVLLIFYRLVSHHHNKLYAPSDFNDEENFVRMVESKIEQSPKLNQLEELTEKIQQEIDNQPLYRYTKLTEIGKVLTLMLFKEESVDLSAYSENHKFEISDVNNQASQLCEYGWAKLENNSLIISEKGTKEISTFQDICYGRMK